MSYSIEWYVENRVVLLAYSGRITLEDIQLANTELMSYLDHTSSPLVLLCDLTHTAQPAFKLSEMLHLDILKQIATHPNLTWVLYFTNNYPIANLYTSSLAQYLNNNKTNFFRAKEEALSFLEKIGIPLEDSETSTQEAQGKESEGK